MQKFAEFHTIHVWHENIGQNNVYGMFLYKFCCLFTVFAVTHKFAVQTFPVDVFFDGITDKDFVIYE